MAGRLHALLVGIDAYPYPIPALAGCVNDVAVFADVLRHRVGVDALDVRLLTDGAATRERVIAAFTEHLGRAGADDTALFYFSGHGSQQDAPQELWASEPDRRNETIVCVDSRTEGSWDIADKELAVLAARVAASGCHLLVVLDCCHSGGGTRDVGEVVRLAPADPRRRPVGSFVEGAVQAGTAAGTTRGPASRWATATGRHVLLAACRSSEKAREVTVLGRQRGVMSAALEAALLGTDATPSYREVLRVVTADVLARVQEQHPQLESTDATDLDRPFLGGALPARPRQLTLSRLPDGWSIDSGAVHGVPEPVGDDTTELAVYPLTGETSGTPLARGTVTRVLPDRSLVDLDPPLDPSFVYRAVITSVPLRPVRVEVTGDGTAAAALRRAAEQADRTLIDLAGGETSTSSDTSSGASAGGPSGPAGPRADLVVEATPDGFVITRPGVPRPLVPVVAGPQREERTIMALGQVARWLRLSALTNPATRLAPDAVRVTVSAGERSAGRGGTLTVAYAGEHPPRFTVRLENTTTEPLWAALLDLTETYGIFTDAFAAGSVALGAGESTAVDLVGELSDALWLAGTVAVTDQLMVVTSTLEFDPRTLEQPELDVEALPSPGAPGVTRGVPTPRSSLEGLLASVRTRSAHSARAAAAVADWRTDSVRVVTTRPRP